MQSFVADLAYQGEEAPESYALTQHLGHEICNF